MYASLGIKSALQIRQTDPAIDLIDAHRAVKQLLGK
jgi:hypothetical protein